MLCAHNALWKAEKSHNNIVSIPQQNTIGKVALQSIANKPSGQQAVLCLRMTSIKRILKLGRWGSLMSRAGIEDMEGQKGERSSGIAESGSGGGGAASQRHCPKRAITAAPEKVQAQVPRQF